MKILKRGRKSRRKFVCGACGCVFLARPSEFHEELLTKSTPDKRTIYDLRWVYISTCPWCGAKVEQKGDTL